MLLAIDIGNSHTVLGLFRGEELLRTWRLRSEPGRTSDEWAASFHGLFTLAGLGCADIDGVAIVSVVPPVLAAIAEASRTCFGGEPLVVRPENCAIMPVRYDNPGEVGADRLVNAIAAYACRRCSLIVIDLGTATTFDVVSQQGEYLGGAIAPGLRIAAEALSQRTSRLPRVEIACPPRAIATNTLHSMQSGLVYGYVALVDGLTGRMRQELGGNPRVVATGGLAALIAPHSRVIDEVDPDLTLNGLRIIFERNCDMRREG